MKFARYAKEIQGRRGRGETTECCRGKNVTDKTKIRVAPYKTGPKKVMRMGIK